ncbi:outer envelope protein 61-like [Lolium rigidum]|uniref:outer envelope protein 61-like n=1 Tax=Lolium rigidum TaxID=89674 RepID=UPI001F5E2C8A|nr:outer envelope protein 61-like [Lolium rigidum]
MMNPELMRMAQEQISRMPPDAFARMQQQVMSNPNLVRQATESMRNMRPEDFKRAAQQLNHTTPEEILCMTDKIANAKPEELAAMKAQADAQMSYAIAGAKMLKQQGNELHGCGQYTDAAAKYKRAKDNLKNVPSVAGQTLQLQCALNLMSCYLKSAQFEECVSEGSEILAYDSSNVKAYYRRGQAYKELGNLGAAVADLSKAHEISPEDETIAEVLRDTQRKLATNLPKGVVIEEIVEEEEEDSFQPSFPQNVVEEKPDEVVNSRRMDQPSLGSPPSTADMQDVMRNAMEDPEIGKMLTSLMKNMSPDMMANMSRQFGLNLTTEDAANAQKTMSELCPEHLQRMMKWMDRAQRGVEAAKKAKNWLIARKGMIIAIVLLILAFILQQLVGFFSR